MSIYIAIKPQSVCILLSHSPLPWLFSFNGLSSFAQKAAVGLMNKQFLSS